MSDGITDAMRESRCSLSEEEEKRIYFKDIDNLRRWHPKWFDDYIASYLSSFQ